MTRTQAHDCRVPEKQTHTRERTFEQVDEAVESVNVHLDHLLGLNDLLHHRRHLHLCNNNNNNKRFINIAVRN